MIKIVPAQAEHEADWRALWADYLAFYKTTRAEDVYAKSWERILDPVEPMYSFLAYDGTRAVGLTNFLYHRSFWEIPERCYLNDLIVTEEARGLGAGRALIMAVKDHAAAQGCEKLYWTTAQDNHAARALYDKLSNLTPFIKYDIDL